MSKFKITCYFAFIALLLAIFGGLPFQSTAQAMPDTYTEPTSISTNQNSPETEKIALTCQYPVLSSYAGTYFSYKIELRYTGGTEPRVGAPSGFVPFLATATPVKESLAPGVFLLHTYQC